MGFRESGRFRNYAHQPGDPESLASDLSRTVFLDSQGFVWVGTNNGLSKFDPAQKSFRNYDRQDGLQGRQFI